PAIEAGKPVVLDLSAVNFISSAGLGSIVGMIRDSRLKGGVVRLCSPSPTVRALFTMVHIESIVPVDDDRDSSLAVLASAHG
ncbi:MAG: STAS domain-containing protein, partial [Spirochaetales bacterium]|nr:STAS domain-containing protein [Spirochaetales bacterium]